MPYLPKQICRYPGCQRIAGANGYCDKHKPPERIKDKTMHNLYGRKWKAASKAFLAKHPWCAECARQGVTTAAEVVDHVVPHRGDLKLFWDSDNWQPLCRFHHDQKTARGE